MTSGMVVKRVFIQGSLSIVSILGLVMTHASVGTTKHVSALVAGKGDSFGIFFSSNAPQNAFVSFTFHNGYVMGVYLLLDISVCRAHGCVSLLVSLGFGP